MNEGTFGNYIHEEWIRIYGQPPSGRWQQISLSYSAFCSTLNNRYANPMGRVWSKDSAVPWVCRGYADPHRREIHTPQCRCLAKEF